MDRISPFTIYVHNELVGIYVVVETEITADAVSYCLSCSPVPRSCPQRRERVWWQLSAFLVLVSSEFLIVFSVKASSQSDARPCVALIREMHKFITKKFGGFLTTWYKNAMQGNARIGSESILVSCCVSTSIDAKTTQHNALFSVVLWTGLKPIRLQLYYDTLGGFTNLHLQRCTRSVVLVSDPSY